MSFGIQRHGARSFRHTVGPISFCFFAQANQPLIGAGMQLQQAWRHMASRRQYAIYVPLFMHRCITHTLLETIRYLELNADSMPDYDKRYRAGQRISTGFVESAVNEIVG